MVWIGYLVSLTKCWLIVKVLLRKLRKEGSHNYYKIQNKAEFPKYFSFIEKLSNKIVREKTNEIIESLIFNYLNFKSSNKTNSQLAFIMFFF